MVASPPPRRIVSGLVGTRQLDDQDTRFRLEHLAKSRATEEESTAGPPCFEPRILKELFPKGFTLARDTSKYNGSTKPEGWFTDYTTAVGIASSKKCVALCYGHLVLLGSARTWINSLPAGWLDF
ncbi:DNA mismatch repair protein Mlh1 [Hordeum vulgare]|nr:DNA mismatch repair protein Mlh1 [Hordeum vulgare]